MNQEKAKALHDYLKEAEEKGLTIDFNYLIEKFGLDEYSAKQKIDEILQTELSVIITQEEIDFYLKNKAFIESLTLTKENEPILRAIQTFKVNMWGEPPYIIKSQSLKKELLWLVENGYAKRYMIPTENN